MKTIELSKSAERYLKKLVERDLGFNKKYLVLNEKYKMQIYPISRTLIERQKEDIAQAENILEQINQ